MKICVICNFSNTNCGISNFGHQTVAAFRHAGHDVLAWDGNYPVVYARREAGLDPHLPPDLDSYDVLHVIWHAITLNHYVGVDWASFPTMMPHGGPILSLWDCGPSDAYCPFDQWFPIKWMLYKDEGREGYHIMDYPVPDWTDELPEPAAAFTVGASSVRGDGVQWLREICAAEGWALNLPTPGVWLTIEDEIRRLARSTINVCWYNSSAVWKDRASAPSMLIASKRPLLINQDKLLAHLHDAQDVYHGTRDDLPAVLKAIYEQHRYGLMLPLQSYHRMRWSAAIPRFLSVWKGTQ